MRLSAARPAGGESPARLVERAGLSPGLLDQLAQLRVEREAPALEEGLELVPAEPAHRVVQAALGDRPFDQLGAAVEAVEPERVLDAPSKRDERIRGRIGQRHHEVLGLALGDLAEPPGVGAGVHVRQRGRRGQGGRLDVLELGHAREHGLLACGREADPDAPVRAAFARDHLDLGDRAHAPLGSLRMANLLADLE